MVLKGGTVIELKGAMVRRGNTVYLTRKDGTALSVPASEIDNNATAAARAAVPPPPPAPQAQAPATPAEAVRASAAATKDGPKAKVKITDSDVSHPMDLSSPEAGADKDKAKKELAAGGSKVELVQYDQKKEGNDLIVSGQLRNPTQQAAENVKLNVTVLDEKGQPIDATTASLSNGIIESGDTIQFTAKIAVGDRIPASLRFAPTWTGPKPTPAPAPARPAGAAPGGANRPAAAAPAS